MLEKKEQKEPTTKKNIWTIKKSNEYKKKNIQKNWQSAVPET